MSFDIKSSKFSLEIESDAEGYAVVYVPWLHYRASDDSYGSDGSDQLAVEVSVSQGDWSLSGQLLSWKYEQGGKLKLELERAGGALSPRQLGTIVK